MDQPCTVHCTTQCSSPSDMHWSQIQFYALYSAVPVYWTCYEVLTALHFDCALWLHTVVNHISPVLWNAHFYFKLCNLIFSSFADELHGTAWSWWDILRLLQLQIILFSYQDAINKCICSCVHRSKLNSKCDYMQLSTIVNFVTSAIVVNLCFAVLRSCSTKYICATSWYCTHNQMQFWRNFFLVVSFPLHWINPLAFEGSNLLQDTPNTFHWSESHFGQK